MAKPLRTHHDIESVFVCGADLRAAGCLTEGPPPPVVLLHYVSYGYARRGCPWWLVRGIERWRRAGTVRRLVTVIHEINASGPPWTSAFWLKPVQRHLAWRIARASHVLWTSLGLYGAILSRWAEDREVVTLPVPSSIGEPATIAPLAEREPRLIVFGTPGLRQRAYGRHRDALTATCRSLGIRRILDVGAPAQIPAKLGDALPVERRGTLPNAEVSRLLASSRAAFLAYPPDFLEKSSVFAAYAAHGVAPVCAWHEPRTGVLEPYRHFLPAGEVHDGLAAAAEVASGVHTWYEGHPLHLQATLLAERLTD